jgi:threonine aldolase
MEAITAFCRDQGIGTHLDGARLYMMSAASGIEPREYAALFDTVYVSLYKYFGAPFGAILAGDSQLVDGMFHTRRMFGGGLASAYFAAALALRGIEGFSARFEASMLKARVLFKRLNALPGIEVKEFDHGSNIFPLRIAPGVDVASLIESLHQRNVFVYPEEAAGIVSSLTVNTTLLTQSNEAIFQAFREALNAG